MTRRNHQNGFTLIELIVILVLLGIVGSFLISFMGSKITNAPDVALIARREGLTEMVMERIIADYLVQINGADPDSALTTIAGNPANDGAAYESLVTNSGIDVQFEYITFNTTSGVEQTSTAATSTLKVTITSNNQNALVTLLSTARTTAGAANEDPVNY